MKKIFLILLFIIALPLNSFASSVDDILGYWLTDDIYPVIGEKVTLIIKKDTLRHRELKHEKIIFETHENPFIIRFEKFKKVQKVYDNFYYKIIVVDNDHIFVEKPGNGSMVKLAYHRITEEEAKQYLR